MGFAIGRIVQRTEECSNVEVGKIVATMNWVICKQERIASMDKGKCLKLVSFLIRILLVKESQTVSRAYVPDVDSLATRQTSLLKKHSDIFS